MVLIAWLSSIRPTETVEDAEAQDLTRSELRYASAGGFDDAYDTVISNCSMCHAREPVWGNMQWAPKGVHLETPKDVARHANEIYLQAGASHAMPPPNAVQMGAEARTAIVSWVQNARAGGHADAGALHHGN
jgi:uncharacterized membrane protein